MLRTTKSFVFWFFYGFCILFTATAYAQIPTAIIQSFPFPENDSIVICPGESVTFQSISIDLTPNATFVWEFGLGATPVMANGPGPHMVEYPFGYVSASTTLSVDNNNGMPPSLAELVVSVGWDVQSSLDLVSLGLNFSSYELDSEYYFVHCNSLEEAVFEWESSSAGFDQTFDWGDGTAVSIPFDEFGLEVSHTYPIGSFVLTHTVSDPEWGCSDVATYHIFNGSAPNISFQSSGTNTCFGDFLEVDFGSNGQLTDYELWFSDSTLMEFTTSADTIIQHQFISNSCDYETDLYENAFMLELIASNGCSFDISTNILLDPIFVSSAPDAAISSSACPACSQVSFVLTDISDNAFHASLSGCSDSTLRYWVVEDVALYAIDSGELGQSNGYLGDDYVFGGWTSGTPSLSLIVEDPGLIDVWLYTGNVCGYDSILYSCEVLPTGEVSFDGGGVNSETGELVVCSGAEVSGIVFDSTLPGDTVYWTAIVTDGISGVTEFGGFGETPLIIPTWEIYNSTITSQFIEIQASLGCDFGGALVAIEVLPIINILLGPSVPPDTICSGEELFILVNTDVHDVVVEWTAEENSGVEGSSSGNGPYIQNFLINSTEFVEIQTYTFATPLEACPADPMIYNVAVVPEFALAPFDSIFACPADLVQLADYSISLDGIGYAWNAAGSDVGIPEYGSEYLIDFIAENTTSEDAVAQIEWVVDLHGCSDEETLVVTVYPRPNFELSVTDTLFCSQLPLDLDVVLSVAGTEFEWEAIAPPNMMGASGGDAIETGTLDDVLVNSSSELDSVLYVFTTTEFVCPAEPVEWYAVVVPDFELASLSDFAVCTGEEIEVEDYGLPVAGMIYSWEIAGDFVGLEEAGEGNLNGWTAENLSLIDANAQVLITATLYGCADSTDFNVLVQPKPVIYWDVVASPFCSGVAIDLGLGTEVEGAVVEWSPEVSVYVMGAEDGNGDLIPDILVNSNIVLDSIVYVLNTAGTACSADTAQLIVWVLPSVVLPVFENLIGCHGEELVISDYDLGVDAASYAWSNSNPTIGLPSEGDGVLTGWIAENTSDSPVLTNITIEASISNCLIEEVSFELTVYPSPIVSFNVGPNGGLDCQTGIGVIEGFPEFGNGSFSWSGPGNIQAFGSSVEVDAAGDYEVIFTDGVSGCIAIFQVEVLDPLEIEITDVSVSTLACYGDGDGSVSIETDGGSDVEFEWSPSVSADFLAEGLTAGTYGVVVTNASDCRDSTVVELLEIPPVELDLIDLGNAICGSANGFIEVEATGGNGGFNYDWGGWTGAVLSGVLAGAYEVVVTDVLGCSLDALFTIACFDEIPPEVSQVITPNGDGFNDVWFLGDLYLYPDHGVKVFNRWGTLVYEASPYMNDWYGTWGADGASSAPLPSATYYYLFETGMNNPAFYQGFIEIQNEGR